MKANERRHGHLRLDPQWHVLTLFLINRTALLWVFLEFVSSASFGKIVFGLIIVQQWMDPQAWKLHFMGPLELSCWQKTDWLNLNHHDLCDSAHSGWIGRNHQKEIGLWSVRALDYCRQGQCLSGTQHPCRTLLCSTFLWACMYHLLLFF